MSIPHASPRAATRIWKHWSHLCNRIGDRRAGSAGEQAAADYILNQFHRAGLQNVHDEPFPCLSVAKAVADIRMGRGRSFQKVPARILAGSPGTPGQRTVEGELVWVEMPEQAERLIRPSLRGKIVMLVGPLPTHADLHQRLVRCKPAAVIHVDDRLPFEWVKADGVYPTWVRRHGMPPTVTIPYRAAWDFRQRGATHARARLVVELKQSLSENVVGEIRGRRPELPVVLLGAHHDTQCDNIGADDNAAGVVALLELATRLSSRRPMRTIRFVSFGAEEQLSVGAARYVAAHRGEMSSIGAVLNIDSVASPLGHHWILRAGRPAFGAWLMRHLSRLGLDAVEKPDAMPFADHFPFSVFGVPAATFLRPNMDSGMRWQHHSVYDNLANVSVDELERVIRAAGGLTTLLAGTARWPFSRGLGPEQRAESVRMARELYDLFEPA